MMVISVKSRIAIGVPKTYDIESAKSGHGNLNHLLHIVLHGDIAEYVLIAALVPLLVWTLDLFATVRGL